MLIILEAVEIMNSWMPFVSITVPVYAKLQRQSKPEPLNGSQRVKLGRRSMQTRLWASGAWMKSKVPSSTAPTMQSVSYVQKVWPWKFFFCLPLCSKKDLFFFCLLNFFFHNLSKITFQSTSIFFFFPPAHNSINIQGTWGPWSDWSPCPALCGQVGVQLRHRNCQSDSLLCSGPKLDGKACNGPECPKTGEKKA